VEEARGPGESGRVFTQENGDAYHPDWISRRFKRIVEVLGLPPIRLHDLRHGSATLSLLAGTDIKVVQERLGPSSRQITSDTYTSVLPQLMRSEAESTISIVPRADRDKKKRAPKPTPAVDEDPTTTDAGATASPADGPDEGKSQAA
jgi:site-specific recombinase XerC